MDKDLRAKTRYRTLCAQYSLKIKDSLMVNLGIVIVAAAIFFFQVPSGCRIIYFGTCDYFASFSAPFRGDLDHDYECSLACDCLFLFESQLCV